ncbi:Fc.00g002210.m01.CDS01 [Cosmosporella sp. VM-42]
MDNLKRQLSPDSSEDGPGVVKIPKTSPAHDGTFPTRQLNPKSVPAELSAGVGNTDCSESEQTADEYVHELVVGQKEGNPSDRSMWVAI